MRPPNCAMAKQKLIRHKMPPDSYSDRIKLPHQDLCPFIEPASNRLKQAFLLISSLQNQVSVSPGAKPAGLLPREEDISTEKKSRTSIS